MNADSDPETISVKSSDNTIRYNTMRSTAGQFTLRHGNRTSVYGNYILGDGQGGSSGLRVYGGDHKIYNNYIAGVNGVAINIDAGNSEDDGGALTDHKVSYNVQVHVQHHRQRPGHLDRQRQDHPAAQHRGGLQPAAGGRAAHHRHRRHRHARGGQHRQRRQRRHRQWACSRSTPAGTEIRYVGNIASGGAAGIGSGGAGGGPQAGQDGRHLPDRPRQPGHRRRREPRCSPSSPRTSTAARA